MSILKKSLLKKIIRLLLLAVAVACTYALVIEILFSRKKSNQPVVTEFWSHRGVNNDSLPENTIAAFERVLKHGLTGIETDVFWNEQKKQLVITHDTPDFGKPNMLLLDDVTARFKDSVSYWIDFKNLTAANQKEAEEAFTQLVQKHNLCGKLYIESANAFALRKFNSQNIKKLYWVQFGRKFPVKQLKLLYLKSLIVFSNFDGYTSGYRLFDESFRKEFDGFPLYIFHADAKSIEKESKSASFIKVQLVDGDYLKEKYR